MKEKMRTVPTERDWTWLKIILYLAMAIGLYALSLSTLGCGSTCPDYPPIEVPHVVVVPIEVPQQPIPTCERPEFRPMRSLEDVAYNVPLLVGWAECMASRIDDHNNSLSQPP